MSRLVIGSRGSKLALWQAHHVQDRLRAALPGLEVEIRIIRTQGDRDPQPFEAMPGKGFFVKEIEEALLAGGIDLAVHSMKDLPAELPPGLDLAAVSEREDPRDALVTRDGAELAALPRGARVGTGSPRRASQLLAARPDLRIEPLRGNVDTRVRRVLEGDLDAAILACAGLNRLQIDAPRVPLDPSISLPAVGQGALGLEIRAADDDARRAARVLDHPDTAASVRAERVFLEALGGGCQVPIAALGVARGEMLGLSGVVAQPDGKRVLRAETSGPIGEAEALGRQLAATLLQRGAAELLRGLDRPEPGAP